MTDTETPADLFPKVLRTVCYALGALLGLGVGPALLAVGQPSWAGAAMALSGAFNALAFGYRPDKGV